jgi:hypothetical protein
LLVAAAWSEISIDLAGFVTMFTHPNKAMTVPAAAEMALCNEREVLKNLLPLSSRADIFFEDV